MKAAFSENKLVLLLFVLVLISFSLAQENTREVESFYTGKQAGQAFRPVQQQPSPLAGQIRPGHSQVQ